MISELFHRYPTTIGRQALAGICKERGLTKSAVEIGVWRGDFSRPFFEEWDGEKMYLVDPWAPLKDYDDIRAEEFNPDDYEYVKERFIGYSDRVEILKMTSLEALDVVPANLDFVYIDGNHEFSYAYADMVNWWAKLHKGGILAGHDLFASDLCGVTNALVLFANQVNKTVNVIANNYDSWFIVKD